MSANSRFERDFLDFKELLTSNFNMSSEHARPSYLGRRMANFARAASPAEQTFAGSLKCHDSTST